jgi:hypothetical protein
MIDIVSIDTDLRVLNSKTERAKNVLSVQLGSLEYASDFGVDLAYFMSEDYIFQNESFKAYLIQRLAESSIDVASVIETFETLYSSLVFNLSTENIGSAMVR